MRRPNVLLLCDDAARHTGTVDEHIRAFQLFSVSRVVVMDSRAASEIEVNLDYFDAIVFHYSIVIALSGFLPQDFFARLAAFRGPKVLFIQDEYRWVDRTAVAVRDLGVTVVFTVVNRDVIRKIYKEPLFDSIRFEQTLTGFVPTELLARRVPDYAARPIDVSYRARRVPSWLGEFGQEKWIIGERFLNDSARYELTCDIAMSENSRIYGQSWINFVANSKAVLGTESGASFIDFSGNIQRQVEEYERYHPNATFREIQGRFLHGDGCTVIHVISPRCFEAAALRTLMILYPGDYSGVLEPDRHYVPLARDHSNMDEVISIIRDPNRAHKVIQAAYEDIACSQQWTYRAFVAQFDAVISVELKQKARISQPALKTIGANTLSLESEFIRLEQAAAHKAKSRVRAMSWAVMLQKMARRLSDTLYRVLPAPVAGRVTGLGALAFIRIKPLVQRLLFGRAE